MTTKVAAEALGVNPRTVRAYIERGDLDAKSEGEGIQKTYLVSINSLYTLRDSRGGPRNNRRKSPENSAGHPSAVVAAEDLSGMIRDLTAELVKKSADAAEFRTRMELTAQAESSLREALERERERVDRLEAELQEARKTLPVSRDTLETPSEGTEGTDDAPAEDDAPADVAGLQEGVERRSWWRRFFGFE